MLAAADEASDLLKALANRHRLIIVCQLIEKERSVGELAALLNMRDFDRVAAPRPAAQGRARHGAPRRPDHLVFDRQRAGARTGRARSTAPIARRPPARAADASPRAARRKLAPNQ